MAAREQHDQVAVKVLVDYKKYVRLLRADRPAAATAPPEAEAEPAAAEVTEPPAAASPEQPRTPPTPPPSPTPPPPPRPPIPDRATGAAAEAFLTSVRPYYRQKAKRLLEALKLDRRHDFNGVRLGGKRYAAKTLRALLSLALSKKKKEGGGDGRISGEEAFFNFLSHQNLGHLVINKKKMPMSARRNIWWKIN